MSLLEKSIEQLEQAGYCRLPGVYTKAEIGEALERVNRLYEESKDSPNIRVPFLNVGQPTVYNLQNKEHFFLELLFKPKLMEQLLIHFLNDRWFKQIPQNEPNYVLRSLIARSSNAALPMHIDSFVPYQGDHVFIMQYSIILKDQNPDNGCTVLVPGSHRSGAYTTQEAFKDAVPIESEAGDVVMWDSRLWHGTTENRSGERRWAIVATFCRWWLKQQWNIPLALPQENYERLTPSQKAVLGFCSFPYNDEMSGIDMKRGYDALPERVEDYNAPAAMDAVAQERCNGDGS